MIDESTLRLKAREAIQAGRLPDRRAERMWGGPGSGACCTVCDRPVNREELGFELDFARDDEPPGVSNYHVHIRCFAAWEFELQHTQAPRGAMSPSHQAGSAAPPIGAPTASRASGSTGGDAASARALPAARNDVTISASERDTPYRRGPV